MKRPLSALRPALLPVLAAAALAACAPRPAPDPAAPPPEGAEILALPSGEAMDFADLAARAAAADLVIIGEIHDQPAHQRMQAALIAAIRARAAAFEMVPAEKTGALAALRAAGGPEAAGAAARADADWDRYAAWAPPIAALAPEAPAIGAGQPRAALRKAVTEADGAAAFAGDAARFGLDQPLPAAMQAAMVEEQVEAHCGALPAAMAPGMVEAQRLRDAAFAAALLDAHAAGDAAAGPPVLVTGNGHARRGRGSPRYLAAAAPELSLFVIGQAIRAPGQDRDAALAPWAGANPEGAPFDAVVLVPAEGRGAGYDPCAGLRARAK